MKIFVLSTLVLLVSIAQGQFSCSNVRLYDQMIVNGDQPMLHKLKPFDLKLIPDTTLLEMKKEIIDITSSDFFAKLKIKSVKLMDSARAVAWSWTNNPIVDENSNPVYFFYAVLFEIKTTNDEPFVFRLDVLKNGKLLKSEQITFFKNKQLKIVGCANIIDLVLKDTIQPITSIEDMALAYSPKKQAIIWTVTSNLNPKTGLKFHKEVNALTGEIISRTNTNMNTVPAVMKIE